MYTVVIVRRDATSPVTREDVKHVWWQDRGQRLVLAMGEHGKDRRYEHWPVEVIDHVRIVEHQAHQ